MVIKIGQKVRVKDTTPQDIHEPPGFVETMYSCLGQTGVVTSTCFVDGKLWVNVQINNEKFAWAYLPKWLEVDCPTTEMETGRMIIERLMGQLGRFARDNVEADEAMDDAVAFLNTKRTKK